jgi:hypothetical protein
MTTEKIQFFISDLAYKLEVGEIKEIHIAEQNGRKVLRLECEKSVPGEYKTVKVSKKADKQGRVYSKTDSADNTKWYREAKSDTDKTFTQKLADGAKDFFLNPERNKGKFGGPF